MNKNNFLSLMNMEDKNSLSNIYEKIVFFQKTGKTVFINEFLTPNVWSLLISNEKQLEITVQTFGLFEEAERRMVAFSEEQEFSYPIKVVCIKNKSKFSNLKHKDYLGAVMSLGIKREKIGDIVLHENLCFFPVCEEISGYILNNLKTVGNSPCSVEVINDSFNLDISPNYTEISVITTSLRIDCVVSSICNISRNKAIELIAQGKVQINYLEIKEKDKVISFNDRITIRGFGKFNVKEEIGSTQKGRIKLLVKKYI